MACTAHIGRWHCHQAVRASFFSNVKYAAPSQAPSVPKGSLWQRLNCANCTRHAQQSIKGAWSSQRSSSSAGSFRSSSNSPIVPGCLAASHSDKSHCNGSPSLRLARLVGGRVAPPFSSKSRRRRKVPQAMLAEPELTEIAQSEWLHRHELPLVLQLSSASLKSSASPAVCHFAFERNVKSSWLGSCLVGRPPVVVSFVSLYFRYWKRD
jgi:hypothetical protein